MNRIYEKLLKIDGLLSIAGSITYGRIIFTRMLYEGASEMTEMYLPQVLIDEIISYHPYAFWISLLHRKRLINVLPSILEYGISEEEIKDCCSPTYPDEYSHLPENSIEDMCSLLRHEKGKPYVLFLFSVHVLTSGIKLKRFLRFLSLGPCTFVDNDESKECLIHLNSLFHYFNLCLPPAYLPSFIRMEDWKTVQEIIWSSNLLSTFVTKGYTLRSFYWKALDVSRNPSKDGLKFLLDQCQDFALDPNQLHFTPIPVTWSESAIDLLKDLF